MLLNSSINNDLKLYNVETPNTLLNISWQVLLAPKTILMLQYLGEVISQTHFVYILLGTSMSQVFLLQGTSMSQVFLGLQASVWHFNVIF